MEKQAKFLTIISILLSISAALFANDISGTVQEGRQTKQKNVVDFKSDYNEHYSMDEIIFAVKYYVNPRNPSEVWGKYKSLIRAGVGMAVGGGVMYTVGIPASVFSVMFVGPMLISTLFVYGFILGVCLTIAGVVVQALCSIPFSRAYMLASRYSRIYNVTLKNAVREASIASMHDCETKEVGMAVAFGIK